MAGAASFVFALVLLLVIGTYVLQAMLLLVGVAWAGLVLILQAAVALIYAAVRPREALRLWRKAGQAG